MAARYEPTPAAPGEAWIEVDGRKAWATPSVGVIVAGAGTTSRKVATNPTAVAARTTAGPARAVTATAVAAGYRFPSVLAMVRHAALLRNLTVVAHRLMSLNRGHNTLWVYLWR
jgi:hypothetical protein